MPTTSTSRSNVLLIMTDQQRADSIGAYGAAPAPTPHLDRLAAEGATFDAAYCTSPLCTPSRASILTGKHLAGHGVSRLYDSLPQDEVLVPEHLREDGYRTGLVGKLHVSSRVDEARRRHPHDGFDVYELCNEMTVDLDSPWHAYSRWVAERDPEFHHRLVTEGRRVVHYPEHLHMSRWAAERTIDLMAGAVADQVPFFAVMSLFDPHNPYENAPPGWAERVGPLPPTLPPWEPSGPRGLRRETDSKTVAAHTGSDLDTARRGYHAAVAFADHEIGRVLAELERLGCADDTLVVFTSDHGDELGDRGLMTKGAFFTEACARVPLVLRWPGRVPAGRRVAAPVQLSDVAATALAAAGVPPSALGPGADSYDLVDLARGGAPARPYAVSAYRNGGLAVGSGGQYFDPPLLATMLRDDRYKLIAYHDVTDPDSGQLFDLTEDPDERHDLWDDPEHRDRRDRMLRSLLDWTVHDQWRAGPRGGESRPTVSMA
ncbi:sulfatase family protein [Isoptericola aurantiacus]|uniref:sulfatase family protein n=1 Tax=Isoptericola aurantiacus TaxID=3377839 RepID=UPI00383A1E8A